MPNNSTYLFTGFGAADQSAQHSRFGFVESLTEFGAWICPCNGGESIAHICPAGSLAVGDKVTFNLSERAVNVSKAVRLTDEIAGL